jgi:hypothetical protein
LEGEAFGILQAALFGEVKGSRSSASGGSAFISDKEETIPVQGEIQRLVGALQLSLCLQMHQRMRRNARAGIERIRVGEGVRTPRGARRERIRARGRTRIPCQGSGGKRTRISGGAGVPY